MPTGNYGFDDTSLTYFLDNYILHPDKTSLDGMPYTVLKPDNDSENIYRLSSISNQSGVNKIFVLKYNYKLTSNLTLPANSILKFEGGKIYCESGSSFTLTGNNTKIIAPPNVPIFDTSVNIAGTWDNPYSYPEWFSGSGSDNIKMTKASILGKALILSGQYTWNCFTNYDGNNNLLDSNNNPIAVNVLMHCDYLIGLRSAKITIDCTDTIGNRTDNNGNLIDGNSEFTTAFAFDGQVDDHSRIMIDSLRITFTNYNYSKHTGTNHGIIVVKDCKGIIIIKNSTISRGMGSGFNIWNLQSVGNTIQSVFFEDNVILDCDCGIIFLGDRRLTIVSVIIKNNTFYKTSLPDSEPVSFYAPNQTYGLVAIENNTFYYSKENTVRGTCILMDQGTFAHMTIRGNTYWYPGNMLGMGVSDNGANYGGTAYLNISQENIIDCNKFNPDATDPSIIIKKADECNISDSLILRMEIYESNVDIANITFCHFLRYNSNYNFATRGTNDFHNYAFVMAENSKINLHDCDFVQSRGGYNYCGSDLTTRLYRNIGGSLTIFKDIYVGISYWTPGDLTDYNIINTRIGKRGGGELPSIIVTNPYQGKVGDIYSSGNGTLTVLDQNAVWTDLNKLHITFTNTTTSKDTEIKFNFGQYGTLRIPIKAPVSGISPNVSEFWLISKAFDNYAILTYTIENSNKIIVRLPFDITSLNLNNIFDDGGSGITLNLAYNNNVT